MLTMLTFESKYSVVYISLLSSVILDYVQTPTALTAIMVYQNWATFRRRTKPVHSNGMVSLTMIIRSAIFGLTKQLAIVYVLYDYPLGH